MYVVNRSLTDKKWKIDDVSHKLLLDIFSSFRDASFECYLVGGCVRDLFLKKEPHDYDICTSATPEEIINILSPKYEIIETGLKHGTVTIYDPKAKFSCEITTFRAEAEYSDNRHPDAVSFVTSLEEDLKRRDFTVNSFAYDLLTDQIKMLDESYLYDLELGIIRTVGDPVERFNEDALRILRAIRFSAQLNFTIETKTFEALKSCGNLLSKISKERIRDELTKILLSDAPQVLEILCVQEIEQYLFDGMHPITDMVDCEHQNPWHYTDVFHHTMDVIKGVPKVFELRWAAFFHDIGKPIVKALKPGTENHYRYIGHPEASYEICLKMMDMLKFSNKEKELISKFVRYHDYPLSKVSNVKFKQKIVEFGVDNFKLFLKLRSSDAAAHKLDISVDFAVFALDVVKERFRNILMNKDPLYRSDLAVDGDDLKALGMDGKDIGDTLDKLLLLVLEKPHMNDKKILLTKLKVKGKN